MADRLAFGMRLAHSLPGSSKSKSEYVKDAKQYIELGKLMHWRRALSSLYEQPMKIDGLTFQTAEHYLQYRKLALANEKKARELFAMESLSVTALGSGWDAQRKRKAVLLSTSQWKQWEENVMAESKAVIRREKFRQGTIAYRVLMATGDAELWHVAPRCRPVRMHRTEARRASLRAAQE